MLEIICGRSGSGKSHYLYTCIKKELKKNRDKKIVILVPEQYSFQAEKKILEVLDGKITPNIHVLSFNRLAWMLFQKLGGSNQRYVNASGKNILIYNILKKIKDKLTIFSKAASTRGFVKKIARTIAEFKRYNISPIQIEDIAKINTAGQLIKFKELSEIYALYEKMLHEFWIDSDDTLKILAQKLEGSDVLSDVEIWIDNFDGFTPQQYELIDVFLKEAKEIHITFCMENIHFDKKLKKDSLFYPVERHFIKIHRLALKNNIKEKITYLNRQIKYKNNLELAHLEKSLFHYPFAEFLKSPENISVLAASNIYEEVEAAAQALIDLCINKGYKFCEMAIMAANPDIYKDAVSKIFKQHNIPFFIDGKEDILKHPITVLIRSIFEISLYRWDYEDVFKCLKSGLLPISDAEVDLLENFVLERGIKGKKKWTEDWSKYFESSEPHYADTIKSMKKKFTEPLINFYETVEGKMSALEMCREFYMLLLNWGIPEVLKSRIKKFETQGEHQLASYYRQVWDMLVQLLDQVAIIVKEETVTLQDFYSMVMSGLEACEIGIIPPSMDEITIGAINHSRMGEKKVLLILGANDGIFPLQYLKEGVLSDLDREFLESRGLELSSDTRTKAFEQQFALYRIFSLPHDKLIISYSLADSEGKTIRPSIYITILKKIFPKIKINVYGNQDSKIKMITTPEATLEKLVNVLREGKHSGVKNHFWSYLLDWYKRNPKWQDTLKFIFEGEKYENRACDINQELIKKIYPQDIYTSVSRLEQYRMCPFSYYAKYMLEAKPRKLLSFTPVDIGLILHKILENVFKGIDKENMDWESINEVWIKESIEKNTAEVIEKYMNVIERNGKLDYFSKKVQDIIEWSALLIFKHIRKSLFRPVGYEIEFGRGKDYPPMEILLKNGKKLYLSGKVDRLDKWESKEGDYLRIIDYKSGFRYLTLSDIYHGLKLQLMTYMSAIRKYKPFRPAALLNFKLDKPFIRFSKPVDEQKIKKELNKQLRMKGIILKDKTLISAMDTSLMPGCESDFLPLKLNKNGEISMQSTVIEKRKFDLLERHILNIIAETGNSILKGKIPISPCKFSYGMVCRYCDYSSFCQFEPKMRSYRKIEKIKEDEIWERLKRDEVDR